MDNFNPPISSPQKNYRILTALIIATLFILILVIINIVLSINKPQTPPPNAEVDKQMEKYTNYSGENMRITTPNPEITEGKEKIIPKTPPKPSEKVKYRIFL